MNIYYPGILFYTDNLPDGCRGCANGPIIRISPKYTNDQGLHEHEAEHVRQWWKSLGLHSLLYLLSKKYRLWSEVAAYRVQLQYPPAANPIPTQPPLEGEEKDAVVVAGREINPQYVECYAAAIADKYDLDISREAAAVLLRA
ncbi:MAG TPA: hypothetical protein P5244_12935 [Syntrophales bacterium]|nr:hypothetical protein [Syntrophales bacterium]HRT71448.1 hypothetical protein [Syntrophales bacterium]